MTEDLLEELRLYCNEGVNIEFKQAQYMLQRPRPEDHPSLDRSELDRYFKQKKSELLKDILALANAWHEGSRYILIGFREDKPNPPVVVGLAPDQVSDDAKLQQFVNANVNQPLVFSYDVLQLGGKAVAVLTIPQQTRPFYAISDYGGVKQDVVYVRRGSATDEAKPDEVRKMAVADARQLRRTSVLVDLIRADGSALNGAEMEVRDLDFGRIRELPDFLPRNEKAGEVEVISPNRNYWRDLALRWKAESRSLPVKVGIKNNSDHALSECKVEVHIKATSASAKMVEAGMLPRTPKRWSSFSPVDVFRPVQRTALPPSHWSLEVVNDRETPDFCICRVARVLPGEEVQSPDRFLIVPRGDGEVTLTVKLLANELASPKVFDYAFSVRKSTLIVDQQAFCTDSPELKAGDGHISGRIRLDLD